MTQYNIATIFHCYKKQMCEH